MTIDEARKEIIKATRHIYEDDEAINIAELLIENITRLPRSKRITRQNHSLSTSQEGLLHSSITRLQEHEPIQYVISESWFAGMRFYVDRNVLIPRPETEELVDWVVKDFKGQNDAEGIPSAKVKILDVGTGSGCIAIALKRKLPGVEMWACDVSDEALNVARLNADVLHATIDFVPLNFLDATQRKQLPAVDVIVSNPPYIPKTETKGMRNNVVGYEPSAALFVPDDDPMIFYKAIVEFAQEKLNKGKSIYVEIHENYGEQTRDLFQLGGFRTVQLKKDLQEKDRMIKAVN
jgi:release factor glutamine methyltransferase